MYGQITSAIRLLAMLMVTYVVGLFCQGLIQSIYNVRLQGLRRVGFSAHKPIWTSVVIPILLTVPWRYFFFILFSVYALYIIFYDVYEHTYELKWATVLVSVLARACVRTCERMCARECVTSWMGVYISFSCVYCLISISTIVGHPFAKRGAMQHRVCELLFV